MGQILRVHGGIPLSGTVTPAGNKNAALPMIASALLADGATTIRNVPNIQDVHSMLALMGHLGCTVEWLDGNTVCINSAGLRAQPLDRQLCARIRASILLAGPLLARLGKVTLPPPGGDVIGRRRVDTHFLAFERLGATVEVGSEYNMASKGLVGADVFLDEPSVTATENALMAATLAKGVTTLRNAASEPHVQDLARGLVQMGARIDGIGTNTLTIEGVKSLTGCDVEVGPDYVEIGSFIGLAAVTNSELTIDGVRPEDLTSVLLQFARLGVRPTIDNGCIVVADNQERRVQPDLGGHVPKIEDGPWPAFSADLMSIALVVATQCEGQVLIFEKMYESRLFFVDKLIGLGARIVLCDPHRAVVMGPSRLEGGPVHSPDIRAGMAMLLAALAAHGESVIYNVGQIDRGYERIDERLRRLGAKVTREEGEPS